MGSDTTCIRPIGSADLLACARLFVRVFSESPYEESWSVFRAHKYLGRFWAFDPEHCFLVHENDVVIAAMFGYCSPGRRGIDYTMRELFVDADRRRSGHGRKLVRHLLSKLGDRVSVSLIANEKSTAASFYEDLGLRQHECYKFYCGTLIADSI